jgi:hypothetical protein
MLLHINGKFTMGNMKSSHLWNAEKKNFNDDEIYEIKKKTSQVNVPE